MLETEDGHDALPHGLPRGVPLARGQEDIRQQHAPDPLGPVLSRVFCSLARHRGHVFILRVLLRLEQSY